MADDDAGGVPADEVHDAIADALEGIEAALDEVAEAIARMG